MKRILLLVLSTLITIITIYGSTSLVTYSNAFSYYGSKTTEVGLIQNRLKSWGYYNGPIDSIYGYETFKSVKYFQSKNGLKSDGICGQDTLSALGISAQKKPSISRGNVDRNVSLLAHLVNGEARGEPYTGQVAVAAVVLNRTRDGRFPRTIAGVIYQRGAFDAVSDGQINIPASEECFKAAKDALNGWDPSSGAVYYYNPQTATSKWIWTRQIITVIGSHNFAK